MSDGNFGDVKRADHDHDHDHDYAHDHDHGHDHDHDHDHGHGADELHVDSFYHPDYDGPIFTDFQTTGARWTDGGGVTTSLGGSGGTINWSLAGAGLSDATGNNFFSGTTVALGSFLNYDFAAVIQDAFDQWSTYGDINFVQVADSGGNIGVGTTPTIRIVAGAIDGNSNVLARAFTPASAAAGGDIVFDSGDASFYSNQNSFRLTAMHEIGHAIGLSHENSSSIVALMNPMFNGNLSGLQPDDIAGIQAIYGSAGSVNPDLIAGNVAVSNTSVASGDTMTVTYDITNDGDGVAANTTTGIYISTDSVITSSDTFITSELSDASNAVGAVDSESVAFVVPTLASGTYYVGVIADVNQTEPGESDEANNASPSPVAITVTGIADDFGETTASAGTVAVNGSSTGDIQFSGDQDWFRATLMTGVTYTINLDGSSASAGTLSDPFFRGIYDSTGTLIANTTNDDGGSGLNSMLTYTATYSGNHYLSAGAFSTNQGTYTLSVSGSTGPSTTGVELLDGSSNIIGNYGSLQDAVDAAADGYVFNVDAATYTANPESVTVDVDDAEFSLPTGVTPTFTMANTGVVSLTVTGSGNATVIGNSAGNVVESDSGNDSLSGGAGDDVLNGGTGTDTLNGGADTDTATYIDAGGAVSANLATGSGTLGEANGDTYISIENLIGSSFADTLIGGAGSNTLSGGVGADVILDISGGDDVLLGGNGADQLQGGAGADILDGGFGLDSARYNTSDAAVFVNIGADTASGGHATGDELDSIENLVGSQFGDTLTGHAGANVLDGFAGDDTLQGGAGADTLIGSAGFDTADYSDSTTAIDIGMFRVGTGGTAQGDTLNGIEAIIGSDHGDTLVGTGFYSPIQLDGGDGNDLLFDYGGVAVLNGGAGDDTMIGRLGADQFDGGADTDVVRYADAIGAVNANLATGMGSGSDAQGDTYANVENLVGSRFFDTLVGDAGDNRLEGLAGRDTITGGEGNDQMFGGADLDTFVFTNGNWGNDIIHDFDANPGREKMDMSMIGNQFSDLTIVDTAFGVRVDYDHPSFGIQTIALGGVDLADITADDFIFAI